MHRFILDSNVAIKNPNCIADFGEDNEVYIPQIVIDELDRNKKGFSPKAHASRTFTRNLLLMREHGSLHQGVKVEGLPKVFVLGYSEIEDEHRVDPVFESQVGDCLLLSFAATLNSRLGDVILVTDDGNVAIHADSLGLEVQAYEKVKVSDTSLYDTHKVFDWTEVEPVGDMAYPDNRVETPEGIVYNEYFEVGDEVYRAVERETSVRIVSPRHSVFGIKPRNIQQRMAIDAVLNNKIQCVCLVGPAGCGKTLIAMAAALHLVTEMKNFGYERVIMSRPVVPMGREIGHLPGTMREKIEPYMAPFYDSLEVMMPNTDSRMKRENGFKELEEQGLIQIQVLGFIRGRSVPNSILLVDEAQQLTPHEIKTILTRAGEGTKVIFCGDPYQIDDPYLNEKNCGLSYVIDRLSGSELFAKVVMTKGERSPLAQMSAELL